MRRPVHPAALLAVGVFLGWALAQPFLSLNLHLMSNQHAQPWWWADPEDEREPDPEADYESEQRLTDLRLSFLMHDLYSLTSARSEYEAAFRELQALFTAIAVMQSTTSSEKDDDDPSNDVWTRHDELVYRTVDTLKALIAEHINKAAAAEQKYSRLLQGNDTNPAN